MNDASIPLQVLFVERGHDQVVVDCLVSERIVAGPGRAIAAGEPVTFRIGLDSVVGELDSVVHLLEQWSEGCSTVMASGSVADGMLLLRTGDDEVVFELS